MRSLTSLTSTEGIVDLTGIEYAVNLVSLDVRGNRIHNLKPLSGLTRLEHLSLSSNAISDIRPLKKLTNLIFLDLHRNKIADISPVTGLTKLVSLNWNLKRLIVWLLSEKPKPGRGLTARCERLIVLDQVFESYGP